MIERLVFGWTRILGNRCQPFIGVIVIALSMSIEDLSQRKTNTLLPLVDRETSR